MFNRGYLFHGVLDMSLLEMVISGHAVKGKKLQAIIFSCLWHKSLYHFYSCQEPFTA